MTTRVVHVNDNIDGAIYVGRAVPRRGIKASKWANPYRVHLPEMSRHDAIDSYDAHLTAGKGMHLLAKLPELRGKALSCWCRHHGEARADDNACHGDVLVGLLERYTDDELHEMGGVK